MSIVWIATQLYATQNTAVQTMQYRRMYQTRSTQAARTPSSASGLELQLAACSTLSSGSVRVPAPPTGAVARLLFGVEPPLKPDTAEHAARPEDPEAGPQRAAARPAAEPAAELHADRQRLRVRRAREVVRVPLQAVDLARLDERPVLHGVRHLVLPRAADDRDEQVEERDAGDEAVQHEQRRPEHGLPLEHGVELELAEARAHHLEKRLREASGDRGCLERGGAPSLSLGIACARAPW